MKTRIFGGSALAALAIGAGFGGACAQTAARQPAGGTSVEEVIVTAQKREQSLQDVPLSVAAVTDRTLKARVITDFSELQNVVPGLTFAGANTPRGAGVSIRGIGTVSFSDAIEGSVAVVLDGVPIGRQGAGFTDLADLERIEVLRGPQGTLFGKNASAGVINIVTKRPARTLAADGQISYGEDGDFKAQGEVSGPLAPGGRVRGLLSAYSTQRDGSIVNLHTNDRLNGRDEWGVRGKIEADLTDSIDLLVTADYTRRAVACCMWTTRTYGSGLYTSGFNIIQLRQQAAGIVAGPDNLQVTEDGRNFQYQQTRGTAVQLDWKLPFGPTLTSITGARSWGEVDNNDADQTPLDLLNVNQGNIHQHQYSEELRLTSPVGGRFDYVAGLFYFKQATRNDSIQQGPLGLDLLGVIPPGLKFGRDGLLKVDTQNYAGFGDVTWHALPKFRVFAGGRVTHEDLAVYFDRVTPTGDLQWPGLPPFLGGLTNHATAFSWRTGVQYDFAPRVMGYATVAQGYKGAGFEVGLDQNYVRVVRPEIPVNYEVGVKSELFDRRLVLDADAYFTRFGNFQAQTLVATAGGLAFDTANAGTVHTQGVEASFTALPFEGLTLSGGATYTDAYFQTFTTAACYTGQALTGTGCVQTSPGVYAQDLSGKPLPAAPEWNTILSARYERPVSQTVRAFSEVDWTYRSKALLSQDQDPLSLQAGYSLVDLTAGVTLQDRYTLRVFAKNVFDQRYAESIFDTPFDSGSPISRGGTSQFTPVGAFRTIGVAFGFRY